jgi:protein-disulfide isomerase
MTSRSIGSTARRTMIALVLTVLGFGGPVAAGPQSDAPRLAPPRGDASAPVVVLLFSDFECPYCARVEPVLQQIRQTFKQDVQVVFKHSPLPIHPRAPLAHQAALEAAAQGRFWEMHDLLFANQQQLDKPHLVAHARTLGLDLRAFEAALDDGRHQATLLRDVAEARALGVTGTPTLFVNGRRFAGVPSATQLTAHIESVLAGKPVTDGTAARIDPRELDLTDIHGRGPADAPVTIVEFSDFQCPFCGRAVPTIEEVFKSYPGKIRLAFKHFPLDFHPDAPLAHRAALSAGEQGKFWEMHDLLFANQRALRREDLLRHAATLALDLPRFTRDLEDARFDRVVGRDLAEGTRFGVDGTPTTFVNGHRIVGAQPLQVFKAIIDRELGRTPTAAFVRPAAGTVVAADVLDAAMSRGPVDAAVTIQWFADFGSPLHKDAVALLKRALAAHPNDLRLVFNHRPLEGRDSALFAHEISMAAAEQGKFWEVHDLLVARPLQERELLLSNLARLGVDRSWLEEALSSGRARAALERQAADATARGVRGTPTFIVNGKRIDGLVNADALERAIAEQRLPAAKVAQ